LCCVLEPAGRRSVPVSVYELSIVVRWFVQYTS
jgi:hypothetical protein